MKANILAAIITATLLPLTAYAGSGHDNVADSVIKKQRALLEKNTDGKGFGPQSPRDIDTIKGMNARDF
ncbi:MAG: hypothetical protein HRT50_12810, partial [Colwellia sp.]|nr:hypothetical protein [Colwellia sp.]